MQQAPAPVNNLMESQNNEISQISESNNDSELDSSEEALNRSKNFNVATGVSPQTINAIQLKQKIENEAKDNQEIFLKKQETQKKIEELFKICN